MEIASVIVPTRNRIEEVRGLLASLAQQTRTDFEVLVIDDGSTQPVSPVVSTQAWPFKLRIKRNDAGKGPAAARNTGLILARTERLLFTDDDCRPEPDWVARLSTALAEAPSEVGGIGGRTIAHGSDIFSRYYEFHRMLDPLPHDRLRPDYIPYLVTANCAIRRDPLLASGGFDCRIPSAGGEDVAASLRLVKAGYVLTRCHEAIVRHRFRPGLKNLWRTYYRYGLGGRFVVDRYLPL